MQPAAPVPAPPVEAALGSGPVEPAAVKRPPLPLPSNQAEALGMWNTVLDVLEELRKFSLAGTLRLARVMQWTGEHLELGFPLDVHAMGEMAADKEKLDELRTIIRGLGPAQKDLRVSIRMLDARESASAGARSLVESSRESGQAERQKREAEAREHPITKHVIQTFGAQIREIKTDV